MKMGVSLLLFNLKEGLKLCGDNNLIQHIEIGVDNLSDCEEILKYKDKIKELNLSVGIHLPMELNTCEEVDFIRDKWVDFIDIMHEKLGDLNVQYYNMHLGYVRSSKLNRRNKKYLHNSVDFFDKLSLSENLKDVCITMENAYSDGGDLCWIGNNREDFSYIFDNTKNKNLYFCYDSGHDLINRSDYFSLKDKFKVLHLSDNDGHTDQHLGLNNGILSEIMVRQMMSSKAEYLVLEMDLKYIKCCNPSFQKN